MATVIQRGYSAVKPWHLAAAAFRRPQQCPAKIFLYGTNLTHFYKPALLPPNLNPEENHISNFYCHLQGQKCYSMSTSAKVRFPERTNGLLGPKSDRDCESQSENEQKPEEIVRMTENSADYEKPQEANGHSSVAAINQGSNPLVSGNAKSNPKRNLEKLREEICKIIKKDDKDMEESLNQIGIRLTSGFLNKILANIPSPKPALRFFEWAKTQPGFEHTSQTYDRLVNIAGRSKDFETLEMLLAQRLSVGCINSAKTFSFATVWRDDPVLLNKVTEVFNQLEDFGKRNAYDMLIAAFCKENHVDVAMSVLQAMLSSDCAPNPCTYHPFILAYCRSGRFDKVYGLFQVMEERDCSPDTTCYNFLLSSLCQRKHFAEAAEFLRTMVNSSGGKPDAVTYDILILSASKRGKMEGALQLFSRLKEEGFRPMYTTYTHLISGLLRAGDFDKAHSFVNGEGGRDRILDASNYSFLVRTCSKLGKVEQGYSALMEMEARDLNPDPWLYKEMKRKN